MWHPHSQLATGPSHVSGQGFKICPICVCVSVSQNLMEALALIISWISLKAKLFKHR